MKNIFLLISAISLSSYTIAQDGYFSGIIHYHNTFYSGDGKDITPQMSVMMGKEQEYIINEYGYKSILKGSAIEMQVYDINSNTYYNVAPNNYATPIDASNNPDPVVKTEILDKTEIILGRECNVLIISTNMSITAYYYDPKLKVNAAVYRNHNYGNWNKYMELTDGALPLKWIMHSSMFSWEATATELTKVALKKEDVTLPSNIKIIK